MCGYLLYPSKPSAELLTLHLERQKHRGEDGYGAIALTLTKKKKVRSTKHLKRPSFVKKHTLLPRGPILVHHRKASVGGIKPELVHPIPDETGQVLVMQNGTRRALADIFMEASDTKALAEIWDEVSDYALYYILEGCGVVFAMDRGKLFFHRDSGRTLYKCTEGRVKGMYASEPVEEGMWALVDEYMLKELPLDMAEWDLEHGTPQAYTYQQCGYYSCNDIYIGLANSYRCPDCDKYMYTAGTGYTTNQGRRKNK